MFMSMDASADIATVTQRPQKQAVPTLYIVLGIVLILAVAIGAIVLAVWLASSFPAEIEAVRDIIIIAFALESCLFGIVLLMVMMMLIRLINMLEFEIKPILEKTNETVGLVRGTSSFISDKVVRPTISARSYIAGARSGFRALVGNPRRNLPD